MRIKISTEAEFGFCFGALCILSEFSHNIVHTSYLIGNGMSGVGSGSCGPQLREKEQLKETEFTVHFRFSIKNAEK